MKWLLLAVAAVGVCQAELYTDRYDDININEILQNRRLLVPYVKCILGQGRCTAEGKELRLHVKDAMQTSCEKCTLKQRQGARQVVSYIKTNEKDYWDQLKKKYDPNGTYEPIYEAFLAKNE